VIVLCTPELSTLRDVRDCQRIFGQALHLDRNKVSYWFNHPLPVTGLTRQQFESASSSRSFSRSRMPATPSRKQRRQRERSCGPAVTPHLHAQSSARFEICGRLSFARVRVWSLAAPTAWGVQDLELIR
jgi:hypothetical protein